MSSLIINGVPIPFRQLESDAFFNSIASCIYWKDKNGIYLGCNDATLKTLRLKSREQMIGKSDYDLWSTHHANELRKTDMEAMSQNKVIETEESITLPSGQKCYFFSVKAPLKDEHGEIIGVVGSSFDITDFKTRQKNSAVNSRAITQFLALMSHELRIPLTGIISTASMLAEENVTLEETREFSKIIVNSGNYLLSTLNNILDFAKLEADKFELIHTRVNLNILVEEIFALLGPSAKEKGLKLQAYFENELPYVITDPRALRHIMINLVSNAIKFTDHGSVSIFVRIIEQKKNTIVMSIAVKDTGPGIPNEKIDFIFDRFSQLENVYIRKNSRSGTGLGLSLVKKLTELLGGKIEVTSTLGVGSTFTFSGKFLLSANRNKQPTKSEYSYDG